MSRAAAGHFLFWPPQHSENRPSSFWSAKRSRSNMKGVTPVSWSTDTQILRNKSPSVVPSGSSLSSAHQQPRPGSDARALPGSTRKCVHTGNEAHSDAQRLTEQKPIRSLCSSATVTGDAAFAKCII